MKSKQIIQTLRNLKFSILTYNFEVKTILSNVLNLFNHEMVDPCV